MSLSELLEQHPCPDAFLGPQAAVEGELIGHSEEGRPLHLVKFGKGPKRVSLLAGCHSDEPLGPHTLRWLVSALQTPSFVGRDLAERFTFFILVHINPDGEAQNRPWIEAFPDFSAYLDGAFRELPGRDVEFGFPAMRVENRAWTEALEQHGPFDLHMSLHGMGVSEGFLLLLERHRAAKEHSIREGFEALAQGMGFGLHDHDRKGDKGFHYYGAGFSSTPEGQAMRDHFLAKGDESMASRFHSSSMEWVRRLGGDPLCLVTELPLFAIHREGESQPGVPLQHQAYRCAREDGWDGEALEQHFDLRPLGVSEGTLAMVAVMDLALEALG